MENNHFKYDAGLWKFAEGFELGDKVDITDPCYDKDVWCRMTVNCKSGKYNAYVEVSDEGEWGKRVKAIAIAHEDCEDIIPFIEKAYKDELPCLGYIGVDAGLAGFFNNKPDYCDEAWREFCDICREGNCYTTNCGVFSDSGFGDGEYNVYTNKEGTVFIIVFITDEDEEYEGEYNEEKY